MVGTMSADVDELIALGAGLRGRDAAGRVHDHRHVDAALVRVLLVPLERCVAALCPPPRVVRVAVRATDVVDPSDRFVGRLEDAVEELHLVHHAERAALLRRAVVGEDDQHRVVELAECREGRRRADRSGRRCGRGTRRTLPAVGRPAAVGSRGGRPRHRHPGCGVRAVCPRGSRRARAGVRTNAGGRRPSPRRNGRGTSRGSSQVPGAARASRRTATYAKNGRSGRTPLLS